MIKTLGLSFAFILSFSALAGQATLVTPKEIKWQDVPGFEGIQVATVEGDAAKGPHHSFTKFKAGFSAPVHHHSPNHYMTVIAGTMILTVDGKEHHLPSGSYFAFKGKKPHATKCAEGEDCVIFGDVRGKWDVVPEKK